MFVYFLLNQILTFYRYCLLTFAPTTTLKIFLQQKTLEVSNLDKRIALKIKSCIIYLKYRFVSDRKVLRVVAVPTVKKNGRIKENVPEKHIAKGCVFENCI